MKLYVNEKLFSLHNKFYVTDENDNNVYEISSKIMSIGHKTTINDMNGNTLIYIEQEIFHLMPNYNVYINNELSFKISKKISFWKNNYSISNGYRVEGGAMMYNFTIYDDNNNEVGSIKRKMISVGDKYEIDIIDESKKEIVLGIIVAISNEINDIQTNSD